MTEAMADLQFPCRKKLIKWRLRQKNQQFQRCSRCLPGRTLKTTTMSLKASHE
ncbi:hypothetical protein [Tardiphaga sp. 367_B4_N1_1]|uniref:hypothetical protein n=1 Tax=Tardiphaga sp. 367_B4_N1_1 TaxID=3240777 RepID=UPI003F24A25D